MNITPDRHDHRRSAVKPPHDPPHPPTRQRARRVLPWVLGVLTVLIGAIALAYAATSAASLAPPAAVPGSAPAEPAPDAGIGPGTWIVGTDITAGTYLSAGAAPGTYCHWSTHVGASSNSELIDFGSAQVAGQQLAVEIGDDVGAFTSSGCEPWRLAG